MEIIISSSGSVSDSKVCVGALKKEFQVDSFPNGLKKVVTDTLAKLRFIGVQEVRIDDIEQIELLKQKGGDLITWVNLKDILSLGYLSEKDILPMVKILLYHLESKFIPLDPCEIDGIAMECAVCGEVHLHVKRLAVCSNKECESYVLRKKIDPNSVMP